MIKLDKHYNFIIFMPKKIYTEIKANEKQTLSEHLELVTNEGLKILNTTNNYLEDFYNSNFDTIDIDFEELSKDVYIFTALLHDFGKHTKAFQKRLNKRSNDISVEEYHNFWYLYTPYLFNIFFPLKYPNINPIFVNILAYISCIVIHSHHFNLSDGGLDKSIWDWNKSWVFSGDYKIDKNKEISLEKYVNEILPLILDKEIIYEVYNNIPSLKEIGSFLATSGYKISWIEEKKSIMSINSNDVKKLLFKNYSIENIKKSEKLYLYLVFILFPTLIFADKKVSSWLAGEEIDKNSYNINNYYTQKYANSKIGINNLRDINYKKTNELFKKHTQFYLIDAPTWIWKSWSLFNLGNRILEEEKKKKLIYLAPFVSILEQNYKEIKEGLEYIKERNLPENSPTLSKINYLTSKSFELENGEISPQSRFHLQTYNSKYIFTTFVNFFWSLYSGVNRESLKVPTILQDAVIIIDEIQDFSEDKLFFLKILLDELYTNFNSIVVFASATIPHYLEKKLPENTRVYKFWEEKVPGTEIYFNRQLYKKIVTKENKDLLSRIWKDDKNILFINFAIKDSRALIEELGFSSFLKPWEIENNFRYFILNTEDSCAYEREQVIKKIKEKPEGITTYVFATALIKAGVDIDMDIAFIESSFNLLDITQIGGRVNRSNKKIEKGKVFIYDYKRKENYNKEESLILIETHNILKKYPSFSEYDLYTKILPEFKSLLIEGDLDYLRYMQIFDFAHISKVSKFIEDSNDIRILKDPNKFVLLKDNEKIEIYNFYKKIKKLLENNTSKVFEETLEVKWKKYNLYYFLVNRKIMAGMNKEDIEKKGIIFENGNSYLSENLIF